MKKERESKWFDFGTIEFIGTEENREYLVTPKYDKPYKIVFVEVDAWPPLFDGEPIISPEKIAMGNRITRDLIIIDDLEELERYKKANNM